MHPAYSVIFFTTASGAGYGLLFWLSVATMLGDLPVGRAAPLVVLTLALLLITAGLLASTFHLGHPERALGAFSQWRSSWLSREGVLAVATYAPAGLLWLSFAGDFAEGLRPVLAFLSGLGAIATVYCTGMIYASLRTIREWHRQDVPLIYLALAAGCGAVLLALIYAIADGTVPLWVSLAAFFGLAVGALLKGRYWQQIDADLGQYTAEMATGLGHLGKVRPLDPPHTMPNFVMREMGYTVARRHATRLRRIAGMALFVAPLLLLVLSLVMGLPALWLLLAVLAAGLGVVTERWLFFAEASHVSQLYYGASRA